jgi:hypothetical protein
VSKADTAWAAGLFEGEGCIWVKKAYRNGRNYAIMGMQSTDEDVLRRFQAVVGGTLNGPYQPKDTRSRRKPYWCWQLAGRSKIERLLGQLWPYLGERRRARATEVLTETAPDERRRSTNGNRSRRSARSAA